MGLLRVSSHVITACSWTEGPFLADGTVRLYGGASLGHTIRLPSVSWTWIMGNLKVTKRL
jgi:hypothetical protein